MQLQLDPRIDYSIALVDVETGETLAAHRPDARQRTASIGKLFLLVEVARALESGELSADEPVRAPVEHRVEDSGLWYLLRTQALPVWDAAVLVAAVSDNLATNALLHRLGLERVAGVAAELGYERTQLLDYIRDDRGPEHPWTPSFGTGGELADFMRRLALGEIVSPQVSAQVLDWLSADVDTALVVDAFAHDPLAHRQPDAQGVQFWHKTGAIEVVRADVGLAAGPGGRVAYAALAEWGDNSENLHEAARADLRRIGDFVRERVTGAA